MSLTLQQKHDIEIMLNYKATLLEWRDGNRNEVSRLTRLFKVEDAKQGKERDDSWEMRCDLRHDITLGNELVEKQTSLIVGLSMTNIARRVDANVEDVIYYERASIHTERRPAVRQKQIMTAIERKKGSRINIPVFCASV